MKEHFKGGRKALLVASTAAFVIMWLAAAVRTFAGGEDLTLLRLDSSRFMFLQVCSECHEPERGYLVIDDPGEWAATVSRMMGKGEGHVTLEKVSQYVLIMRYGTEYKRYQEAFFEARCGRCHDRELMQQGLNEGVTEWHDRTAAIPKDHTSWITNEEYELVLLGLRRKASI